ncbi:MAG: hypothetical protein WBV06_00190 [Acidimicrobiia bacterium]
MTDDQARRIAQLNARRSQASSSGTSSQVRSGRASAQVRSGRTAGTAPVAKQHRARKSRALVLGLSVATSAGLVSGMWTQAALANNDPAGSTALQADPTPQVTTTTSPSNVTLQPDQTLVPVVIPGQDGQPDHVVYLVVTRPTSSSGATSLRSTTSGTTQTTQPPAQAVTPTPRPTIKIPVTRSHGSR